ncbi:MAG: methylmalonyl-CoA mutase, partial [Chitinophagaceae bacterium]|nr:methylmalonyl-CoA mutase [Chitinophagaceae bacterium]
SYFIEALTNEVEEKAERLITKIDALGGSVSAIESGFIQQEIARSAYEYQRKVENGEKTIVGVNRFTIPEESSISVFKIDDSIREHQIEKLHRLRERRDNEQVKNSLETIRQHAVEGTNLMPAVIEAVEQYCTLGEIAGELRIVFGEHK